MYKIVAAVNSMIERSYLIDHVKRDGNVCYFLYNKRYKWSIAKNDEEYFLAYFPGGESLEDIIRYDNNGEFIELIVYSTKEIKTREASESFAELYLTVQNKLYGIDIVLDDIINSAA